jgi:transposase
VYRYIRLIYYIVFKFLILKTMSNKLISMEKVTLIKQLHSQGHSIRSISRKTGVHRKTVAQYLSGEHSQNESDPQDDRLSTLTDYFPSYDKELSRVGVTRQRLWDEYKGIHPNGYGYTQFCEYYSRYRLSLPREAVMHLDHIFGDCLQVDLAGKKLSFLDPLTNEPVDCPVLVCVLPASGFTYVEALPSAHSDYLFRGLNHCLEYMGGVPRNVLSDNMRQFVLKNSRYEFTFTEMAVQWSLFYGTNLEATRVNHPCDKPSVENHVHIIYMRIYARLRDDHFDSLESLNQRVFELLDEHNDCPLSRRAESRREIFLSCERPLLSPLPKEAFVPKRTTLAKVQKNYHVELGEDKHFYSVPYRYIGQQTTLVYDSMNVEVFISMERIATHRRNLRQWGYTTLPEHMPDSHKYYMKTLAWTREYFEGIARKAGSFSEQLFKKIMDSKKFVEQTYRSCTGLKRLMEQYGQDRFESACRKAVEAGGTNYGFVKNILQNGMDKNDTPDNTSIIPEHENIRGEEEYK